MTVNMALRTPLLRCDHTDVATPLYMRKNGLLPFREYSYSQGTASAHEGLPDWYSRDQENGQIGRLH